MAVSLSSETLPWFLQRAASQPAERGRGQWLGPAPFQGQMWKWLALPLPTGTEETVAKLGFQRGQKCDLHLGHPGASSLSRKGGMDMGASQWPLPTERLPGATEECSHQMALRTCLSGYGCKQQEPTQTEHSLCGRIPKNHLVYVILFNSDRKRAWEMKWLVCW